MCTSTLTGERTMNMKHKLFMPINLKFFAEGDGANDAADKGGDQSSNTGGTDEAAGKVFTQEEVNALMAKEKNQGRLAVLKELGVADAKTAKEGLTKYQTYLDSQKTELEKLQGESETEKTARLTAEAKATVLEQKFEVMTAGVKVEYVDDVVALAKAKVTEEKAFTAVLTELKTKYPAFFEDKEEGSKGTGNSVDGKKNKNEPESLGKRLGTLAKKGEQKSSYFKK